MPLYELVIIAKPGVDLVRQFLKSTTLTILNRGGVVRSLSNLLERDLPYRMKAHQVYHQRGHYCTLTFDTKPDDVNYLKNQLALDPRVIRATVIKLGTNLESISGLNPHYLRLKGIGNHQDSSTATTMMEDTFSLKSSSSSSMENTKEKEKVKSFFSALQEEMAHLEKIEKLKSITSKETQ